MVLWPSYTKLLHVRACTHIYADTYAHAHAHKHAHANMRTRARTHTYTHIRIASEFACAYKTGSVVALSLTRTCVRYISRRSCFASSYTGTRNHQSIRTVCMCLCARAHLSVCYVCIMCVCACACALIGDFDLRTKERDTHDDG